MTHSTVVVLPAPFGPMQPEDLAVLDLEAHAPRRFDGVVALLEIVDGDFRWHGYGSRLQALGSGKTFE